MQKIKDTIAKFIWRHPQAAGALSIIFLVVGVICLTFFFLTTVLNAACIKPVAKNLIVFGLFLAAIIFIPLSVALSFIQPKEK